MVKKLTTIPHFVAEQQFFCENNSKIAVTAPALGEITGEISCADTRLVDQAVLAADTAFSEWQKTTPMFRAGLLFRLKQLLEAQIEDLAHIVSSEHGKLHDDAVASIKRGLEIIDFACGLPQLLKTNYAHNIGNHIDAYEIRQPLGVSIGITPFNFPVMVPLWLSIMSIATGNTFILKPSEKVPSAAVFLAEQFQKAGFPKGVFNVIHGGREVVEALITHEKTQCVSFVGSTNIAKHVYQLAHQHHKRVQALGGAKNHMVVMPDAHTETVANAIMGAVYGSAGQRCMAISVVVCVGGIGEAVKAALIPKIKALRLGAFADSADMGPLISEAHKENVISYIALGVKEGAHLVVDGRTWQAPPSYKNGFYLGPSFFDFVTPNMAIYQQEIFGPVLCMLHTDTLEEAIALINNHEYGNGASIYTQSGAYARTFVDQVKAGMVGVNIPIPVPAAHFSFGGAKASLFGDHHVYGEESLRFFTKLKTITQRWPKNESLKTTFSMPTHE